VADAGQREQTGAGLTGDHLRSHRRREHVALAAAHDQRRDGERLPERPEVQPPGGVGHQIPAQRPHDLARAILAHT